MNERLRRLRLARTPGLGPRGACALEREVGLSALFETPVASLEARGVPARILGALRSDAVLRAAQDELEISAALGADVLWLGGPGYPPDLLTLHDPPQVLSVLGTLAERDWRAVAIVGARRATYEGREIAHEIAADLATAGLTVVSGLARGIDRAAHEGALAAGGRTIAVLGCGLRLLEPSARALAERIERAGALVSEFHPDTTPTRWTFPQRNRIVAGLSLGTLVVQAGPRSGALITADLALSEGRELFAVPGSVHEPLSRGPNGLLKEGAHLVENAQDVLEVLGIEPLDADDDEASDDPQRGSTSPPGSGPRAKVLEILSGRKLTADALVAETDLPAGAVLTALGHLELEGLVSIELGGTWRRVG